VVVVASLAAVVDVVEGSASSTQADSNMDRAVKAVRRMAVG
jgi:hypothetical protein